MKKIKMLSLILMLVLLISGCNLISKNKPDNTGTAVTEKEGTESERNTDIDAVDNSQVKKVNVTLFFPTQDNSAVQKEKREIEVKDGAILKASIEALLEGPVSKSLRKSMPDGTRLLDINKKGSLAIVNFSQEYNQVGGSVAEIVERVSVVNTLTGISGIEKVKILVEGKDLVGPSGDPFGELKPFVLDEQGLPVPGQTETITLYFASENADKLVAEKREVFVENGAILGKIVFEELLKGPQKKGLFPVIPEGTKLLSLDINNGLCNINLSREFIDQAQSGSAGEVMTLYALVNSLTEFSDIKQVQFLINGNIREAYIHEALDTPFTRDDQIIQK